MKKTSQSPSKCSSSESNLEMDLSKHLEEILRTRGEDQLQRISDRSREILNVACGLIVKQIDAGDWADNPGEHFRIFESTVEAITRLFDSQELLCDEVIEILPELYFQVRWNSTSETMDAHSETLDIACFNWFRGKLVAETLPLKPADRLADIERRRNRLEGTSGNGKGAYMQALDKVYWEIEREFEIEKKRLERMSIGNDGEGVNGPYDPNKRGLTRQLAMLLLDELFPDLHKSSNAAKAEFLAFLTGFSADGLLNKWVDYRRGNVSTLEKDMEIVAHWKKRLKLRGALRK